MIEYRRFIGCLFLLFFSLLSYGQPSQLYQKDIIFEHPDASLGLSEQSVNAILQDQDGLLWIGTWTGLYLYDGYSTTVFQSNNQLPGALKSNKITALFEDKEGNIWVGSMMGGLSKYDKDKNRFKQYRHSAHDPRSISNDNVWSIVQDETGSLWIGTENGLNRFDPDTEEFEHYFSLEDDSASLSYNFITSLYLDSKSKLWIGTEDGVNRLDLADIEGGFTRFLYHQDQKSTHLHNYVYKITSYFDIHENEVICWSSKKGFKMLGENQITNYQIEGKPASFSLFRDIYTYRNQGDYLLLGSEMGLSIFDIHQKDFTSFFGDYNETVNLSHNTVSSIFIDRTGVLWVGTKKGINKFDTYNNNFDLYPTSAFDPNKSIITGIQQTIDSRVWISTMGGGLYNFSRSATGSSTTSDAFQQFRIQSNLENDFSNFIQKLHADKKGNLWLGTAGGGVYRLNVQDISPGSNLISSYNHYTASGNGSGRLSDNYIMALADSRDDGIWIGTWSEGLNKITANGEVMIYNHPELMTIPIVFLHEEHDGTLWIGTRGRGLMRGTFENNELVSLDVFRHNSGAGGISNDFINTLFEDSNGKFWIGTEGGLNLFDPQTEEFKLIGLDDQTNSKVIEGILEDSAGNIWLSHWKGISVIDPTREKDLIVNEFDGRDRIQGGFFYNNVCLKDTELNLYFGGANGFNIIYPGMVQKNPFQPQIELRDLKLFNTSISSNYEHNGRVILEQSLSKTKAITLKPFENSLTLEFAAIHFSVPEKNQYAYRLKGFEEEWNITDSERRYATYTNLPSGKYVFQLKASNSDGIWSDDVRELSININPAWYKTTFAFVGYVIILIFILYLFRRFIIIRTNYINNIRLERVNRENMERLNKAKLQFFTNVSHEFRTPLTLILGPLEKIINSGEGGNLLKDQLNIVNRNAQRLLRLVNQLLDFRKVEAGKLKLKVAEGDIVQFLKEVKLSFEGIAQQKNIKLSFKSSSEKIPLYFDKDQFEKIFFNLLSNAFNYTPEGGAIMLEIREEGDKVTIQVEDNGAGINPENFKKIFRRFYSDEETLHHGIGIGLALTKSLVELHHGKIDVESRINEFTRFSVVLPAGRGHFKPSEIQKEAVDNESVEIYHQLNTEASLLLSSVSAEERSSGKLKKILLVEDNAEVRAYIKSMFFNFYSVLEAENGHDGLTIALRDNPEVIISDVMMPGMDGITFCRKIKENVKTSHIPVILLTARTSLIFKIEGLEMGADDYITKPFNAKELMLKVRNLMQSREVLKKAFRDNTVLSIEPKKVTLSSTDELFIEKVLECIEKNMSNSVFSVEDFGREMGMSRMQLYRKLKALTGLSANEFIRSIRLKRAAQLLKQSQMSVAEVTYEVGFTDLQYFRTCFKKQFNINPSEFSKLTNYESFEDSRV